MRRKLVPYVAAALAASLTIAPAQAQPIDISGSFAGTLTQGPGRCGPNRITVDLLFAGFLSPFGAGTGTQSACVVPQTFQVVDGSFSFALPGGNSFFGSVSGQLTPIGPGLFQGMSTFIVTGGTGQFVNATGGGTTSGTQNLAAGTVAFQLTGTLNGVQAVPEPSTLALVAGGLLGAAAMRRRRQRV